MAARQGRRAEGRGAVGLRRAERGGGGQQRAEGQRGGAPLCGKGAVVGVVVGGGVHSTDKRPRPLLRFFVGASPARGLRETVVGAWSRTGFGAWGRGRRADQVGPLARCDTPVVTRQFTPPPPCLSPLSERTPVNRLDCPLVHSLAALPASALPASALPAAYRPGPTQPNNPPRHPPRHPPRRLPRPSPSETPGLPQIPLSLPLLPLRSTPQAQTGPLPMPPAIPSPRVLCPSC